MQRSAVQSCPRIGSRGKPPAGAREGILLAREQNTVARDWRPGRPARGAMRAREGILLARERNTVARDWRPGRPVRGAMRAREGIWARLDQADQTQ